MTLEELKAEAKKMGYKLVKNTEYTKFKPCVCGCKRRTEWINTIGKDTYRYECNRCHRKASGKNKKEAKENWNKMMGEEK